MKMLISVSYMIILMIFWYHKLFLGHSINMVHSCIAIYVQIIKLRPYNLKFQEN